MTTVTMQNSFLAGVLSPEMQARTDIQAYAQGLAEGYNVFVDYHGGIVNRAGTQWCFIAETNNPGYTTEDQEFNPRIVPFVYEENQAILLVFDGEGLVFLLNGGPILDSSHPITNVTQDDPGEITVSVEITEVDPIVFVSGVTGMTQLNNRYFRLILGDGFTFQLRDIYTGETIDTTNYGAYISGGTVRPVYRISSTDLVLTLNQIWAMKFVQIRDTMILVSPYDPPKLLTRISNTNWTIATIDFESSTVAPTGLSLNASFTGSGTEYTYVVTATDEGTGVESLASNEATTDKDYWPAPEDSIKIT